MTTQNYLIVENNVVINNIVWDGNVNTWQPPLSATMLIQKTTPAIIWLNSNPINEIPNYVLTEVIGVGDIGFIWNGSVLTTNEPNPTA
jgi:hypothetical protein